METIPTSRESICCYEIENIVEKKQENNSEISCIINHDEFESVCLNVWVLQTASHTHITFIIIIIIPNMVSVMVNEAKKKCVSHDTFMRWKREYDGLPQIITWLDCQSQFKHGKEFVTKMKCIVRSKYQEIIKG